MRWLRVLLVGVLTAPLLFVGGPASANIGWLNINNLARGYFDRNANGAPGQERIAVEDLKNDQFGAIVDLEVVNGATYSAADTHGGGMDTMTRNMATEGVTVKFRLCIYNIHTYILTECTPKHHDYA